MALFIDVPVACKSSVPADALNLAGTAGAIGNTSAALALGDLRTTRVQTYLPGDVPGTPTGDIVSARAPIDTTTANRARTRRDGCDVIAELPDG